MAPLPVPCLDNKSAAHWIESDVAREFNQMTFFMYKNRVITSLEDMPNALMPAIEVLRIQTVQLPHPLAEVSFSRLDNDVIMIPHLTVSMHLKVKATADQSNNAEPFFAISIIEENKPTVITAGRDVIQRARKL